MKGAKQLQIYFLASNNINIDVLLVLIASRRLLDADSCR